MNRPRNRQPRPPRDNNKNNQRNSRGQPAHTNSNVPTTRQVVPGASVSIVLKEDQPTGREVQGTVKDVLTRGDHPRGIKVRLQNGNIGRVQRLVAGDQSNLSDSKPAAEATPTFEPSRNRDWRREEDEGSAMPPPRTLADFIPSTEDQSAPARSFDHISTGTVKCPICGLFEGDEAAVSHHVQEHLD